MRLLVGHQHSKFWPILVSFVDYYSPFSGPTAICTINEPRCAFTCRLSTLVVFVDSNPFHGLLLTVLLSQRDFHHCRTPRCSYVLVVKTCSVGRFWPVSWIITRYWGPKVTCTIDELRIAFTSRSSTLTILAGSGPFHALLLGVLGSQSDFHGLRSSRCVYVTIVNTHCFGQF